MARKQYRQNDLDRRRARRRTSVPGFPCKKIFETKSEVDTYFAGDKIQCLLCGKWFKQISSTHLNLIHGLTADDYRQLYGLPWTRGLVSKSVYDKYSQFSKKLMRKRIKNGNAPAFLYDRKKKSTKPQRPSQPFSIELSISKALAVHGRKIKWLEADYKNVLKRMQQQQRSLNDVLQDPDLPSTRAWRTFVEKRPGFARKAKQIHEKLAYAIQVKIRHKPILKSRRPGKRLSKKGPVKSQL